MDIAAKNEKHFTTLGLRFEPTLDQPEILATLKRAEQAYERIMKSNPDPATCLRATSAIHVITALLHPIMRTPNCGPLIVQVCGASCELPAHEASGPGRKKPCPVLVAAAPAIEHYALRWDRKARKLSGNMLADFVWERAMDFMGKSPALRNRAKGELQPNPRQLGVYLRKAVEFYYSGELRADPESGVAKQLVARYCANATMLEKEGKQQPFYCRCFGVKIASGDEKCPVLGLNGKGGRDEHGHLSCFKPDMVSWLTPVAGEDLLDQAQVEQERILCGGRVTPAQRCG